MYIKLGIGLCHPALLSFLLVHVVSVCPSLTLLFSFPAYATEDDRKANFLLSAVYMHISESLEPQE